ncbi:MAG: peptide ABC transporter substrate-binding protein [Selenomonadaceae bacterium]|nr:peptide ABC transporter substrate-binding protein [Selenomonadaceae bacterium]
MRKLLVLLALVTFLSAGCAEKSKGGNYLPVMLERPVISMDSSYIVDTTSMEVLGNCVEGLLRLGKDGKIVPALAESYDISEDGKTYTFHLRDAKWSNGDDVTAGDFVFAWRRVCNDANDYAYLFSDIANIKNAAAIISHKSSPVTLGVSAPDSKTLVVELESPVPFFLSLVPLHIFYPVNEQFYNSLDAGTYAKTPETFLSNGVFVLEDYQPGTDNIRLRKNESYWDAANVHLDGLNYRVVHAPNEALTDFTSGTLKVVKISGEYVQNVRDNKSLAKNLITANVGHMNFLAFNTRNENLANQNLRLAITHAIDRESLVNECIMDGSQPAYTAVRPNFTFNKITGEDFSADQTRFAEYVNFDIDKARVHLELAKSELGAENFELGLLYSRDSGDTLINVAKTLKIQLEENLPGVTINLQPVKTATRFEKSEKQDFDIVLDAWSPDYADPTTYLTLWETGNANNFGLWSNARYDEIIKGCMNGTYSNYADYWAALHEAEGIVMREAAIAPLYFSSQTILIADGVQGIEFNAMNLPRVFKNATMK